MCGIAGFYAFDQKKALDSAALNRMAKAVKHRGPDHNETVIRGRVGLAIARLAIIDPEGSNQPILNENRDIWMVFNGEVYNYIELRKQLIYKGHKFATGGDGEVVVHGYEEWGEKVFSRLNGMFAIAIWDERSGKLLLARDRVGIKPLYVHTGSERMIFASEIKAILASNAVSFRARMDTVGCYLTFRYIPAPHTIFEGIYKLEPGEYRVYKNGGCRKQYYHTLRYAPYLPIEEDEAIKKLEIMFKQSVEIRLRSDAPLGVFLSGGLDSGFICALVRSIKSGELNSFTVGFNRPGIYNEIDAAAVAAKKFGTVPNELRMDHGDFLKALPSAVYFMEEPMADPSSVAMRELAILAGKRVKVILSGEGGDELFMGYPRYRGEMLTSKFNAVRPLMMCAATALKPFISRSLWRGLKGISIGNTAARHLHWETIISGEMKSELIGHGQGLSDGCVSPLGLIEALENECDSLRAIDKLSWTDMKLWLVEDLLLKKDKMGMSASIEARVPFLDHELVEFACRLDPAMKIKKGRGKHILRRLMKDLLPPEILNGPKIGFAVPLASWFRNELRGAIEGILLREDAYIRSFIDSTALNRCIESHMSGRDISLELYSLLVLELWGRMFVIGESVDECTDRTAALLR